MVALLTLAAAMVCTLGRYVKDLAHSRAILIAMTIMLVLGPVSYTHLGMPSSPTSARARDW